MWPKAYCMAGSKHRFSEGSEVKMTLFAPSHVGQPSESSGESIASVAKIPEEGL